LNTFTTQQLTFAVKQNEFIDAFIMVRQSGYRHIQAVMNNLKFIILDYLAATKFGFWTGGVISATGQ